MDPKKLEIIERSSQIFMRYGIKSITMDDVARELGISKKTLYKYFQDKNELVITILSAKIELDKQYCKRSNEQAENAIDELFNLSKFVHEQVGQINPVVFLDLKKHHPEGWELMRKHKWNFIFNMIHKNILRGISEGVYRSNLNPEIVARLYVGSTDLIMNEEVFPWPEFSFDKVFIETIRFHIRGMASDEGIEYLKQRIKKETNE
ncbi:MAG: TetR/AcrR family transcriptional regulator [Bacteroidetes bacterium]|nr:MAG: TetR/AcrR family transcriptional regulator [Bacteroidota bacterium]